MELDLHLKVRTGGDKNINTNMTDWIDDFNDKRAAEEKRREHYWQVFPAMAGRTWQAL